MLGSRSHSAEEVATTHEGQTSRWHHHSWLASNDRCRAWSLRSSTTAVKKALAPRSLVTAQTSSMSLPRTSKTRQASSGMPDIPVFPSCYQGQELIVSTSNFGRKCIIFTLLQASWISRLMALPLKLLLWLHFDVCHSHLDCGRLHRESAILYAWDKVQNHLCKYLSLSNCFVGCALPLPLTERLLICQFFNTTSQSYKDSNLWQKVGLEVLSWAPCWFWRQHGCRYIEWQGD